ncbi:MAG TPA: prephenate dehydratase [Thermoleophilaceae bacterium]|nr:prephenate dehydratase [Thermoleophilaceae bacterium]
MTTVAYLGPPGTHTEEALLASAPGPVEREPRATLHETVMAVQLGQTDRAVVPIENSLEGGVAATLDALAGPADRVRIVAEVVHPIHHNLIGRPGTRIADVRKVLSIPHATGQCARFLEASLPDAERLAVASTAEAVRVVSESGEPWAALGSALAAEVYGCEVLAADVEDRDDNRTRFVWLAPAEGAEAPTAGAATTSVVFWGFNDESPGALVSVLGELSSRQINLTRIESRPRRVRLGHYMFFADLDGSTADPHVAEALAALEARVHELRLLGSYPSGPDRSPR